MVSDKTLFDDNQHIKQSTEIRKEGTPLEKLKNLAEYSPTFNTLVNGVNVDLQVEPK